MAGAFYRVSRPVDQRLNTFMVKFAVNNYYELVGEETAAWVETLRKCKTFAGDVHLALGKAEGGTGTGKNAVDAEAAHSESYGTLAANGANPAVAEGADAMEWLIHSIE
jgi:hypothetical protein